jgi:stress-induced morphogen
VTPTELKDALLRAFPDADVEVKDLTGTQDHYQAQIVSDAFAGKNRIEQHRLVYGVLAEAMKGPVHALALATYTKDAFRKKSG